MPLDDEMQAAIKAAVEAAMAPVVQAANEAVSGLKKSRDTILAEKKALQDADRKRKADADTAQALRVADKFLKGDTDSIPEGVLRMDDKNLYVARSKVLDPQEYRRLRTVAAEQKRNLQILDDMSARTSVADAPVIHRFSHKGTEYVSAAYIEQELGGPNGYARLKEQNPNVKFHAFRDLNGVSPDVRAAHDAAMGGDDD